MRPKPIPIEAVTHARSIRLFWSKVDQGGGPAACWPYRGRRHRAYGYGHVGRWGRYLNAHRYAWLLANGRNDTDGLEVLHSCDNPPCCNPAHLRLGTALENARDMVARGRGSKVRARGERVGSAVLTESDVIDIRSLRSFGARICHLARAFNCSWNAVWHILVGDTWRHVP